MRSGYIDALIYVLLSSVAFVFLNNLIADVNPLMALLVMSSVALVVFNLLSFKQIKLTYTVCWQHKSIYIWMSIGLALDWVCMVYASYVADPFIAMAALFISLAIIGFIRLNFIQKSRKRLISLILLIVSLILLELFYVVSVGHSTSLGILLGVLAGGAFYLYILNSAKLASLGNLNSLQVLATRFWFLWGIALIMVPKLHLWANMLTHLGALILISFASLIVPIYFNQRAIQKLGAELTSIFIGLVPPVTFVCYVIYSHEFHWLNGVVCLIITVALLLPTICKSRTS